MLDLPQCHDPWMRVVELVMAHWTFLILVFQAELPYPNPSGYEYKGYLWALVTTSYLSKGFRKILQSQYNTPLEVGLIIIITTTMLHLFIFQTLVVRIFRLNDPAVHL